jgi:hypothetical protein
MRTGGLAELSRVRAALAFGFVTFRTGKIAWSSISLRHRDHNVPWADDLTRPFDEQIDKTAELFVQCQSGNGQPAH